MLSRYKLQATLLPALPGTWSSKANDARRLSGTRIAGILEVGTEIRIGMNDDSTTDNAWKGNDLVNIGELGPAIAPCPKVSEIAPMADWGVGEAMRHIPEFGVRKVRAK